MILTLHIDPSWLANPAALGRIIAAALSVESPYPPAGCDAARAADDDTTALTSGMSDPPPAAPAPVPTAPPARPPAAAAPRTSSGPPATGQALYRWLCDHKLLPKASAIGKRRHLDRMVTHWDPEDVAAVFAELAGDSPPAAAPVNGNGRHHHR